MKFLAKNEIRTKVPLLAVVQLTLLLLSPLANANDENQTNSTQSGNSNTETPALWINEPIYFVAGGSDDVTGRFQFSFKYRVFEEDGEILKKASWLKDFHFAYTQTSLWNLSDDSAPFEDSSYRPSFFFDIERGSEFGLSPSFIRTGYEHESNGQGGNASRSMDIAYIWPFWGGKLYGRDWFVAPKIWTYLSKGGENQNISEYRGNSEIFFQYGNEDSWLIAAKVRPGRFNHTAYQVEFSWPTRKAIFPRTGGYLFVQYFDGYGESLLNYDKQSDRQLRVGFAIVR